MSNCSKTLLALAAALGLGSALAQTYPGIGRAATPKEVAAWDIDVRPDFKGLPAGSGSVAKGQDVWEAKCASCHGIFGESNQVFSPLIGGTTAEDAKKGTVANLLRVDYPSRTTLMKVATVSTLWDYIHRAMPWNEPKSLTTEEVYSVTAFLLNLAQVVPDDFTLSNKNIAEVQARMPNRDGMTTQHALWPGKEFGSHKPDTQNTACMSNCAPEVKIASQLPDFARNAHGNLREQNRWIGPQRGADTTKPEGRLGEAAAAPFKLAAATPAGSASATALATQHGCTACHGVDNKIVGPSFADIAKKYSGQAEYLAGKIKTGGSGVWGAVPMPPQTLPDADAHAIAKWLAAGAPK